MSIDFAIICQICRKLRKIQTHQANVSDANSSRMLFNRNNYILHHLRLRVSTVYQYFFVLVIHWYGRNVFVGNVTLRFAKEETHLQLLHLLVTHICDYRPRI